MINRSNLVTLGLCLVVALVLADVDIKFSSVKQDKKNADLAKFSGYCDYSAEDVNITGINFDNTTLNLNITFDRVVTKFKGKGLKVVSTNGTDFVLTNGKIKGNKFGVFFSVTYDTTDGECVGLGGSCSDIEVVEIPEEEEEEEEEE